MRRLPLVVALLLMGQWSAHASECAGVERSVPFSPAFDSPSAVLEKVARSLSPLGLHDPTIRGALRYNEWRIFYVVTGVSDDEYVFFSGDPKTHKIVTSWGGAAMEDETESIYRWLLKNAPGIPKELASCFSISVTRDGSIWSSNYRVERTLSKGGTRSARATNKFARASLGVGWRGAAHAGR